MLNWKEVLIGDCVTLEAERRAILNAEESDEELVKLRRQSDALAVKITTLANEKYCNQVDDIDSKLENMHNQLKKKWDIEDKTFKCDTGSATLRTTKSLIVTDKMALVDRLAEILNNKQKAFDCIRSFDLTTIRKYMDVDLIAEHIAYYDEKQSVIIKGVPDK